MSGNQMISYELFLHNYYILVCKHEDKSGLKRTNTVHKMNYNSAFVK